MNNTVDYLKFVDARANAIFLGREDETLQIERELSELIQKLPLDVETNNRLVALMIDHVKSSEHDAFTQGFRIGMCIEHTKHTPKECRERRL